MRGRAILSAACLVAAVGTSASAQSFGFELTGENRTPGPIYFTIFDPPITIELWAWFDPAPGADLFASANFDIFASMFTWISSTVHLAGPGSSQGAIVGNGLTGMIATQVHDPSAGIVGNPDNPILLWTGEWYTTQGGGYQVYIETSNTSNFSVFDQQGNVTQLFPGGFTPGSITLIQYPSPPTAVFVSGFAWLALRRRRTGSR